MCKRWMIAIYVLCQILTLTNVIRADVDDIQIHELTVSPVSESCPALRYRLQKRVYQLKNDNAAVLYHSAIEECPQGDDNLFEKIDQWRDMPLDQLPCGEVRQALYPFRPTFRCLELAALRSRCEWDMPIEEGFSMLMPSLGTYRKIAYALSVQARLEIAEGQIDEALDTLTTGLSLARGLGKGPTVIQDLVGIAIAAVMFDQVGELIESPETPNLYWALTELPSPLIDLRHSLSYEYDLMFWEIPELRDLDQKILSEAQAAELVRKTFQKFSDAGLWDQIDFDMLPMAWVMMHYVDAREFLFERNWELSRIEALPAAQVVMLYQFHEFQEAKDEMFKWMTLPYRQYREYIEKSDQAFDEVSQRGIKRKSFCGIFAGIGKDPFFRSTHVS